VISDVVVVVRVVDVVIGVVDVVVVEVGVEPEPVVVAVEAAVVVAAAVAAAAAPATATSAAVEEARACGDRGGTGGGGGGRGTQAHDSTGQCRADREPYDDALEAGHCVSPLKGSVAPNATFSRLPWKFQISLECLGWPLIGRPWLS
jgi:hypothetical protein